ncbi:putative cation/H+ exchanger, sodium/solute symporter superfamily [Fagus crenata]
MHQLSNKLVDFGNLTKRKVDVSANYPTVSPIHRLRYLFVSANEKHGGNGRSKIMVNVSHDAGADLWGAWLQVGIVGIIVSRGEIVAAGYQEFPVEPIRNFFAALFLASIGMLIHVQFLWNHVDILLAAVILVIIIKTIVVVTVVKGFGYI